MAWALAGLSGGLVNRIRRHRTQLPIRRVRIGHHVRVTSTGDAPSPAASEVVEVQWWYEGLPPEEQPSVAMQWTKNIALNVVAGLMSDEYTPDGSWMLISRADGQVLWNTLADDATEWPSEYPVEEVREILAESSWSDFAEKYGLAP